MSTLINYSDNIIKKACDFYIKQFGSTPKVAGVAPGRVNLIGEHTDYNDGFVLPIAIPLVTVIVGEQDTGRKCTIATDASVDEEKAVEFTLPDNLETLQPGQPHWANYIKGVIANYHGNLKCGFKAAVVSSVPVGGGLSSSAALEVATYKFLEQLENSPEKCSISEKERALACQRAEHTFAGVPCGIMDQYISIMAQANSALLIDCRFMDVQHVNLNNPEISILIVNSNIRHNLSSSEYPIRRQQCADACTSLGIASLRDISLKELLDKKADMDPLIFKRAHHVVTEIQRTLDTVEALNAADYQRVGNLMVASHLSLRDDYNVSCTEIDQLVDMTIKAPGVYGSRITGGGFGGCTVTLVRSDKIDSCKEFIQTNYGSSVSFYVGSPSQGARCVDLTNA